MIDIRFSIRNPFYKYSDKPQTDYFHFDKKISKNKAFEIQITKWSANKLFEIMLDLNWKGHDHAGPDLIIEIFGYFFNIKLYDIRHWHYEESRWETEEDYKSENE